MHPDEFYLFMFLNQLMHTQNDLNRLPEPQIPNLKSAFENISDAIIIAVVAFAQSVSLAALMAKKHNYTMDSNQELIAYGAGNIFGSFFSCYPFAASVSRSSVQDSAGGRTQV